MEDEDKVYDLEDAQMTQEERRDLEENLLQKGKDKYGLDDETARAWAHAFAWGSKTSDNGNNHPG